MPSDFDIEHKKKLEENILNTVLVNLDKGTLKEEELSAIASFALPRIDQLTSYNELLQFVRDLSLKWPIFKNLETISEGALEDVNEDFVAEQALKLAKEGNIEQAISLATNSINETHAITND